MLGRQQNNQQTIGELVRPTQEKTVFNLVTHRRKQFIDIRVNYEIEPGKWIPTKKGIRLDMESWERFKEIITKIDQSVNNGKGND